jgi:hypothetical protein
LNSLMTAFVALALAGCASGKCLQSKTAAENAAAATASGTTSGTGATAGSGGAKAPESGGAKAPTKEVMKPESKLDRVKVFKADGSLQCGQGKAIPAAEMQKDLGDIQVFSSASKNDGMMRIQVCGSPTGNSNVYEIDRKNLAAALKKGFKEWTFDN